MVWPPQCPDLNLIENLCDVLEKIFCSGLTLPSSMPDLGKKSMQLWTGINVTLQNNI